MQRRGGLGFLRGRARFSLGVKQVYPGKYAPDHLLRLAVLPEDSQAEIAPLLDA